MITGLTLGSILLGVALLVLVLLYLARPFVVAEDEAARVDREEIDGLLLRRDALLRQIRELDDDMEAAKVAPELYQRNRPLLVKQAAMLMQQLDAHGYREEPAAPPAADLDAQMEAAIRQRRAPQQVEDDMEAAIKAARARPNGAATEATTAATTFCPRCGRRVEADDRFCPKCGHNLIPEPAKAHA